MITIQNLSKGFGAQPLLDAVSFHLNPGEKAGLVGRNGHGKTTLFRIIAGQEPYEEGDVNVPKNYVIGYLDQTIRFTESTVLEESCRGLPVELRTEENTWKVKKVLTGLGFCEDDFIRHPSEFSGGYQMRISLAKVLVSEPNLLLLDEPTNFLDIVSIRWLTGFLKQWRNELLVISHDRNFMDSVTGHIIGIHRNTIKKVPGSTGAYYRLISQDEERHEKHRLTQEKRQKQMDVFISSFRAKARHASMVQSRLKTMDKQSDLDKLETIETLSFNFNYEPCRAKCLMEVKDLCFSYTEEEPWLIDRVNLNVSSHDRICIIGRNGKGKTTLLKLLSGTLRSQSGDIRLFPQARMTYFEQSNTTLLDPSLTVEEQILDSQTDLDRQKARNICGAMMFSGDDALKPTKVLSGGEKSRVLIGKMLVTPANLILMDEPTQHLDMESCEALMEAVDSFKGASIIVTHNERILRRVATSLIVFHHGRLFHFAGGYDQFLEQVGWDEQESFFSDNQEGKRIRKAQKAEKRKMLRQTRAEFLKRRSHCLRPLKQKMTGLEEEISRLEQEAESSSTRLVQACEDQNADAIARLSQSVEKLNITLETLYEELLVLEEQYEEINNSFEEEEKSLF